MAHVFWDFEVADGSYRLQEPGCEIGQGLVFVDCGGDVQPYPVGDVSNPLIDLIPKLECGALPYLVRKGVTGVMLPSDPGIPVAARRLSELSDADLQVQIRPPQG